MPCHAALEPVLQGDRVLETQANCVHHASCTLDDVCRLLNEMQSFDQASTAPPLAMMPPSPNRPPLTLNKPGKLREAPHVRANVAAYALHAHREVALVHALHNVKPCMREGRRAGRGHMAEPARQEMHPARLGHGPCKAPSTGSLHGLTTEGSSADCGACAGSVGAR